jgi:hypothetical protein
MTDALDRAELQKMLRGESGTGPLSVARALMMKQVEVDELRNRLEAVNGQILNHAAQLEIAAQELEAARQQLKTAGASQDSFRDSLKSLHETLGKLIAPPTATEPAVPTETIEAGT